MQFAISCVGSRGGFEKVIRLEQDVYGYTGPPIDRPRDDYPGLTHPEDPDSYEASFQDLIESRNWIKVTDEGGNTIGAAEYYIVTRPLYDDPYRKNELEWLDGGIRKFILDFAKKYLYHRFRDWNYPHIRE
ncbi:MAG: hypothetical protein MMC23_009829 [Stictis urceolatum]|nr:hypothetical protein [Stictis urceolata]